MHAELSSRDTTPHTPHQNPNFVPRNGSISSLVSVPGIDELVRLVIAVPKGVSQSERHRREGSTSVAKSFFVRVKLTSAPTGRTLWPINASPIFGGFSNIKFLKESRDLECASFPVSRVTRGIRIWIIDVFVSPDGFKWLTWSKIGKMISLHASKILVCAGQIPLLQPNAQESVVQVDISRFFHVAKRF